MIQPLAFLLFVALFGAPGYLLARRAYKVSGSVPFPGERAAVGVLISFVILSVIAIPAYRWDLPIVMAVALYAAVAVALVAFAGAYRCRPHRCELALIFRVFFARHGVLLIAGVGVAALTIPFARYFPDGADMLYFVGVTRKYVDAGHLFGANVIYGNGTPDSLSGANLWLLFSAIAGWVAGHVEPVLLYGWLAALLGGASLLAQQLFFQACGADVKTSQWMSVFVTAVTIFHGGFLMHGVNVDLLINQSHRAAYPKIVMSNAIVPLLVFFVLRFFETRDRWYLLWTAIGGIVTLQIHPLESAWLGCLLIGILAGLMVVPDATSSERIGIAATTALFIAGSVPYLLFRKSAIGQIYGDSLMASLSSPDRIKSIGSHLIVASTDAYRVNPAYIGAALFLSLVGVVALAILQIRGRALLVLGGALLATVPLGVWSVTAPRAGRLLMLDNLERLTVYGATLQVYIVGAAGAFLIDRLIAGRSIRRTVLLGGLALASVGIVIAHRDRFRFDYMADSEIHDLQKELKSPLVQAMRGLPHGSVVFNGDQVRALRQIVALTDHYPYLLEPYKRNGVGLSDVESKHRELIWTRVMDPAESALDRRRFLSAAGIRYLLIPRRVFASVESSPLFEWIAHSRPGEDREQIALGRVRTDRELQSMLDASKGRLLDRTAPFEVVYGRLSDAMQLAAASGNSSTIKGAMNSFSQRTLGESYALLDYVRRNATPDLQAEANRRLTGLLGAMKDSPHRLSGIRFEFQNLKDARPDFFPEKIDDANPMTGIVIAGRNDSFSVTADLGSLHVLSQVEVTTVFMNAAYTLPPISVLTSIEGTRWEYCGDLQKPFEKQGVFEVRLRVNRVGRYVRLAAPASSGNFSITEVRVLGSRLPAVPAGVARKRS